MHQELILKKSHFLVIPLDKPILLTLEDWAKKNNVQGCTFTAIGAIKDVELGFYELHKKDYIRKTFSEGDFELISFLGNITLKDGKHYAHAHVSIGREDFSVIGGHLFEAKVAVTIEIIIQEYNLMGLRKLDNNLGLQTICGFKS